MFSRSTKITSLAMFAIGASIAFPAGSAWAAGSTSTAGRHVVLPSGLQAVTLPNGVKIFTNTPSLPVTVTQGAAQATSSVSGLTIGQ